MPADDHLSEQLHNYRGQHQPMVDTDDPGIHNLHELFGDDVYRNPQYFTHGDPKVDQQAISSLLRARDRPQARIDIYRSVPPGVRSINTGDWVTTSKEYAKQHGRHPTDPSQDQHVLWAKVNAEHIRTGGNDIIEWGYSGDPIENATVRWKPRTPAPAASEEHRSEFSHSSAPVGRSTLHTVERSLGGDAVARLSWSSGEVFDIDVPPEHRRKGVATSLWNEAQRLSAENPRIPMPKHPANREDEYDAWAQVVGGKLPRRKKTS